MKVSVAGISHNYVGNCNHMNKGPCELALKEDGDHQ